MERTVESGCVLNLTFERSYGCCSTVMSPSLLSYCTLTYGSTYLFFALCITQWTGSMSSSENVTLGIWQ